MASERVDNLGGGVAIIAMTGRFPGANDLEAYWRNLRNGIDSITFFSPDEMKAAGIPVEVSGPAAYVKARGVIDDVDVFDAGFFGYSPTDALLMDPQQRIFLQCAWEALELAAYDPQTYRGLIGVYAGATKSSYEPLIYSSVPVRDVDGLSVALGNDLAYLPTRVSFKLDLKGPSYPVQTACSTSLVAVHLACQGLLNAECDLALAGGVSIRLPQASGYRYQEEGMFSPDGRCRPFDARSQGTLFSNGIGVVVLKRLEDALADGDSIRAVIKGSAVNNDGSRRASFTAPGVVGQTNVVADALASGEIDPRTVSYVETHGSATPLGDSIEIQALTKAFGNGAGPRQYCALGSVKANIGHLDAASGVAGLIKTVLALEHRQIPPMVHFERPNPDIKFESTPFYVNARLTDWPQRETTRRRAGVSAFGFGGTNAHVVLEEAPELDPSGPSRAIQILTVSAGSEDGLDAATANLFEHLGRHPEIPLADAAYTLKIGRRPFRHRRVIVCRDRDSALRRLKDRDPQFAFAGRYDGPDRSVVFVLAADAAALQAIDRDLYDAEPAFRNAVDECAGILQAHGGFDPRAIVGPSEAERESANVRLADSSVAEPALFVLQYALARLWMSWGVQAAAFVGHGTGEYVASCLAGGSSLADALQRAIERGKALQIGELAAEEFSPSVLTEHLRNDERLVLDVCSKETPADRCIAGLPDAGGASTLESMIAALGRLWLNGARVDWAAFYADEIRYRVPLPTYPFERRRYALPPPSVRRTPAPPAKATVASRNPAVRDWFYAPIWTQAPAPLALTPSAPSSAPGVWLVFVDIHGVGQHIADRLQRDGHEVFTVAAGERFSRSASRRFTIDPRHRKHYERVVEEVYAHRAAAAPGESDARLLTGVIHAWGVSPGGDPSGPIEYTVDEEQVFGSVLLLTQALGHSGRTSPLRINVLTTGAHEVTGIEWLSPGRAMVLGLRHVVAQEYPHITCKAIDLGDLDLGGGFNGRSATLDQLLFDAMVDSSSPVVAYRGAARWIQKYSQLQLPEPPDVPARLRAGGVYLITGGLGEIGLATAEYLARTVRARLVLASRSALPPDAEWDRYLATHDAADPVARRIRRVQGVRSLGAQVLFVGADVGDPQQMAEAFNAAERQFGRLDGVIHAAGVVGPEIFKPIAETDAEMWRRLFYAKVVGVSVLDDLVRDHDLDFCLLVSSLSANLGGLGLSAYAAANAFLDAVARLRNRTSSFPWLSINWDTWLRSEDEAALKRAGTSPTGFVMTPSEGIDALHRILSVDVSGQVVVSTGDLHSRLNQWVDLQAVRAAARDARPADVSLAVPRPNLRTAYEPPGGDLERAITEAFRRGLGLEEVGVHDNFFELGGHSLKALELAARLQADLGTEVRVTMFYEAPTAALLARAIQARQAPGDRFADVDRHVESRLQRLRMRRREVVAQQ